MQGSGDITMHMEYPGSRTLATVLGNKQSPWNEFQIWEIARQIVEGCHELQKLGFSHGDVRP
jgi:serine/threonine protein kinase